MVAGQRDPARGAGHADSDVDRDAHAYDGEPVTELGPGEPSTPLWLPALGAAIFLLVGIALVSRGAASTSVDEQRVDARANAPSAGSVPAARPPAAASAPGRTLTPEQTEELKRRLQEMRRQRGAPTGAVTASPPGH